MKIDNILKSVLCTITATMVLASTASAESKSLDLAFLTNNASDFWTIARAGCEQAQKEVPNIKVEFKIPADGTAAEQTRIFDDLLVKGVNGIALSPVDPANQTAMIDKGAAKALIVTQDSDAPKSQRSFYVGTDNVAAGRQAGELIKKAVPNGGSIMLFVGKRDAQNAKERIQGVEETLKGTNIKILDVRTDDTDRVRAKQNVADTLVKNPDIACLVGLWSYNGPAILNAVKDANKIGKVKIVTFDEENDTLQGVKDGAIEATVVQNPYEFGRQAVTLMAKKLRNENPDIPADGKVIVPTRAIDKSNVDEFWANLKKLRGH
ncbi:MAG TPA: sugar-binding protein [Chthoniobacterales bacterium]|nr:sugar-binding protein [Chthoniobacterales bacterium]